MSAMLLADVAPAGPPLAVPTWFWFAFCAGVTLLLVLDMFVFHRHSHEPGLVESAGGDPPLDESVNCEHA